MTEADEMAAFVTARLDEDEAAAKAATPGPWWAVEDKHRDDGKVRLVKAEDPAFPGDDPTYATRAAHVTYAVTGPDDEEQANLRHIARHDPARVLREVEADRKLLAAYETVLGECHSMFLHDRRPRKYGEHDGLLTAVKIRAARFSDHPDYQAGWKP